MKKIIKSHVFWAILILLAANVALFWQFYFKGLLPFPGNLLVSYYFPWNGGGFAGFDPWTTRKGVTAMDVVRQMYPWKTLAADMIKSGQIPLWNPYNFSGTPLLANLQSSIFFPGTILFLVLPYLTAWNLQVIGLPLLFSFFVYLFLRSLKLSPLASVFGGIVAANISYLVVWAEQLVVIQSALFLPLALWGINNYFDKKKEFYLWLIPIFLAFSIFGGHIQTTVYVYLITFAYLLFRRVPGKFLILIPIFSLAISAVQLFPSAELYFQSAREATVSRELFYQSTFPWQNLVTIVAPDFYGNPGTNNFRGRDYGNFQGYFGIVALILALFSLKYIREKKEIRFWLGAGVLGLLFSLAPFAYVFDWLHIPVLSSGYPSRMIFIFQFSLSILAAYGFERITNHH
ncbi:YfhO family protein [Patescibacteria group bacterium]|nr:YfhO family protein [Patescibacteria group bacterium]